MDKNFNDTNRPSTPKTEKESFKDRVGDAVEGIGHKVSEMGLPKVGQKIHDLGDKLEQSHEDPKHPHDV